jgi:hypothetical protein
MRARIYKESRNAMQSGRGRTKLWRLEFEADKPGQIEPLMGWTSSSDTRQQVSLWFDSREEAVAYATREGIPHRVEEPAEEKRRAMSYADNFKFNRVAPWTH